ncbi:MAG: hypothetical protein GY749_48455 [Desulfobacteraceae bacterium]|nr:hypothetical protein [Desulfobacteraceae bacterium]
MLVTINVPDILPQERIQQRIREIEENLRQEAIFFESLIKKAKTKPGSFKPVSDSEDDLRLFWESFGGWQDDRTPEDIISEIYATRTATERNITL